MDEMFEKFILKIPQQISNSILLEYADEFPSIFSYKIIKSQNIDARTIEERISYQKELNKRILEELLVFHSYNIRFLGIKGYFLAKEVYEKPEDRIFDDIDILVSNHDIFNFYRKLVSCSYSLVNNQEMFGQNFLLYNNLHLINLLKNKYFNLVHAVDLRKNISGTDIYIDLQSNVNVNKLTSFKITEFWKATNTIDIEGRVFEVLSPVNNILFLISHIMRHLAYIYWGDNIRINLQSVYEIAKLIQKYKISFIDLDVKAQEYGILKYLVIFEMIYQEIFEIDLNDLIKRQAYQVNMEKFSWKNIFNILLEMTATDIIFGQFDEKCHLILDTLNKVKNIKDQNQNMLAWELCRRKIKFYR